MCTPRPVGNFAAGGRPYRVSALLTHHVLPNPAGFEPRMPHVSNSGLVCRCVAFPHITCELAKLTPTPRFSRRSQRQLLFCRTPARFVTLAQLRVADKGWFVTTQTTLDLSGSAAPAFVRPPAPTIRAQHYTSTRRRATARGRSVGLAGVPSRSSARTPLLTCRLPRCTHSVELCKCTTPATKLLEPPPIAIAFRVCARRYRSVRC